MHAFYSIAFLTIQTANVSIGFVLQTKSFFFLLIIIFITFCLIKNPTFTIIPFHAFICFYKYLNGEC